MGGGMLSKYHEEALALLKEENADMVVMIIFGSKKRGSGCAVVAELNKYDAKKLSQFLYVMAEAVEKGEVPDPTIIVQDNPNPFPH
jgi:uncharacterized protein YbbC (DUF1343 family)